MDRGEVGEKGKIERLKQEQKPEPWKRELLAGLHSMAY